MLRISARAALLLALSATAVRAQKNDKEVKPGAVELPRLEKLDLRWNEVYDVPDVLRARGCVVLTE